MPSLRVIHTPAAAGSEPSIIQGATAAIHQHCRTKPSISNVLCVVRPIPAGMIEFGPALVSFLLLPARVSMPPSRLLRHPPKRAWTPHALWGRCALAVACGRRPGVPSIDWPAARKAAVGLDRAKGEKPPRGRATSHRKGHNNMARQQQQHAASPHSCLMMMRVMPSAKEANPRGAVGQ